MDHDRMPGTPRLLRAINDRAALHLLLEHGRLARTGLSTLTGLSKPTASQMLMRLEQAGLVVSVGSTVGGPGRAAQLYEVNRAAGHAVALDVTSSGTRAVVVDLGGDAVAETHHRPRRGGGSVAHIEETYDQVLAAANLGRDHISHAVIGVAGAYDAAAGVVRHAKHLPGWQGRGILVELTERLGVPTEIENDVNLVALAEHDQGAAAGTASSVLLWSGSGLGAALVVGGRLHRGATGSAGELGYLPVPGQELVRHAARSGTGGFQRAAGPAAVLALGRGLGLHGADAATMVRTALAGGAGAEAFLDGLAVRYATGLAAVIAVVDPELLVLSGPVLQAGGEALRARVEQEVSCLAMRPTPVAMARITTEPVLAGARHVAVSRAREAVFSATTTTAVPSQRAFVEDVTPSGARA